MITHTHRFMKVAFRTTAVFAALMTASCASTRSSPQQVDVSNPTVTYKYRNDEQLIEANQRAMTYCDQYQSVPQTGHFGRDSSGGNIVVFECLPRSAAAAPQRQFNSDLVYNFRTDQELLDVSRDAQAHCLNSGQPEMDSNIVVNSNHSKTVTFRCNQR
jgi:hypothetical protein